MSFDPVIKSSDRSSLNLVRHLVIVAGGRGTRLARASELPKALIPVGGKPVLEHQLELAQGAGISEVTIFAGYLADRIVSFVGDGSRFGLKVRILVEEQPMGNAGALLRSLDALPEHFFVLYGDVMVAADLRRLAQHHIDRGADVTTVAHPNDHPLDSDLLEIDADGWVTAIHACPHPADRYFDNLVNAALYAVRRDALTPWAAAGNCDFAKDVMRQLVANRGRVLAYVSTDYVKDMGTPERLRQVEIDWNEGRIDLRRPSQTRPAIFLDRDGTLIVAREWLRAADAMELIPDVAAALRSLRTAGFRLVVLTNQPVIARGEATEADVATIHRRLQWEIGKQGAYLDAIYVCPHHPDRGFPGERPELKIECQCRKPATGLLERACRDLSIDPTASWMVGDETRDIEMARRGGLRSILVRTGKAGLDHKFHCIPDFVVDDLPAAVTMILEKAPATAP